MIAAGLVLGFGTIHHPFTVLTTTSSASCGSALGGMPTRPDFTDLNNVSVDTSSMQALDDAVNPLANSSFVADCKNALSDRQTLRWALLAPGTVALVAAAAVPVVASGAVRDGRT